MGMPWTLALWIACSAETEPQENWLVEAAELGAPVANGTGYEFETPQSAWLAAEHVVPGLTWSWPPSNIPLFLWEDVLMGENVSDEGSCPYMTASGGSLTWRTDCRSQDGYDWEGEYTVGETQDEDWLLFDYAFDLSVSSEVDDRVFDHLKLDGSMFYVDGDDSPMVRSSQSNLVIQAAGYWSRGFEDQLEQAWSRLAVSGRWEGQVVEGQQVIQLDASVDLGDLGGFQATGNLSEDDCVLEPAGELTLIGQQEVTLVFHGSNACDGCAELTVDGERQANACRGL